MSVDQTKPNPETQSIRLAIDGMRCAGCVSKVAAALGGVPGVRQASVNLSRVRHEFMSYSPSHRRLTQIKDSE